MRLHVDWIACDGRGVCAELLPEVLVADDWGYPRSRAGGDPEVPEALRRHAERAVTHCPRLALKTYDEPGA